MTSRLRSRFDRLPTAAKLLIILSVILLPIGLALVRTASIGIARLDQAHTERAIDDGLAAAQSIESLIARNALALRIAASGAIREGTTDPCGVTERAVALSPAVVRRFSLRGEDGRLLCTSGGFLPASDAAPVAPGNIRLWIGERDKIVYFRVGVIGGAGTGSLTVDEVRAAARSAPGDISALTLSDDQAQLNVIGDAARATPNAISRRFKIGEGDLQAIVSISVSPVTLIERLTLLLPLAMWVLAALVSWLMVDQLLVKPLRRLQRAISEFQPGQDRLALPAKLGPATEIEELGEAFSRAVVRVEQSEQEMAEALDGQRRLVREVHHRVKNNLQVIASLLNIHGRNAATSDARAAYAAIGRRVEALSVVHRNHFAEQEENRGIALRPLLSELAAGLRASAPDEARAQTIELDLESLHTTQDAAVAAAFLVTEIVECAMIEAPQEVVEVSLRRCGELTARLSLSSPVLVPDRDDGEQHQFERILAGLAKQLRSPLERKLGRYSVDLPVFPE